MSTSALEEVKLLQKLREWKLGIPALTASHSTPAVPLRSAFEEVKLLQKLREWKLGIPAITASHSTPVVPGGPLKQPGDKGDTGDDKEDLVLPDTFAQETAVTIEDPNMLKYVEHELAKRKGRKVDAGDNEDKDLVDELYVIPEHLKVKKRNSEESSTQWDYWDC